MAISSVTRKLFIDTKSQKVLFAEAGKDFADFLFNLLALPVGTVTRLLTKDSMVGSLGNLYGSIETICESYFLHKDQTKEALLKPKLSLILGSTSQVPLLPDYVNVSRNFYTCNNGNYYHYYVADGPEALCPYCTSKISRKLTYVAPLKTTSGTNNNNAEKGFMKGLVTYMVTDDLEVKPISGFTMLNSFNIKEIGAPQEKVVHLDMAMGVKLLKASLQSKTVLMRVFLHD